MEKDVISKYLFILLIIINSPSSNAQFSNLNGGANAVVRGFYSDSTSDLYVVGAFNQIGSNSINQVATWDGSNWSSFGSNEVFGSLHEAVCIIKYNNQMIVGGRFDSIGNTLVNNIARWNGVSWESMGNGFNDVVSTLCEFNGELYAGGSFDYSGNDIVRSLAKWNGNSWDTVGNLVGDVYSIIKFHNQLIIGGAFNMQSSNASIIIGFDGINWDTSLSKMNGRVLKVCNVNDTLYACGDFTSTPSNPSNYLGSFYNNSWHSVPIPTGGSNTITDIVEYNNKKYVSGYFTNPHDIGVFNGSGYDSLFNANGFIKELYLYNNQLFIAGQFFQSIANQNFYCVISYREDVDNINEYNNELAQLRVYPNPSFANEGINIKSDIPGLLSINVYDVTGKLFLHVNTLNDFFAVIPKGVYFVKLFSEFKNSVTTKIVIL